MFIESSFCFDNQCMNKLADIVIDPVTITEKLQSLKPDKAAGDDNLSTRYLKSISSEIAMPIAMIFLKSLSTGCIPRDWIRANITPLFKKVKRSEVANYRPVSLTSLCLLYTSDAADE